MFVILPFELIMPMPIAFAASFDPVEFSGESMSMLSMVLTLLLCLLCLLGAATALLLGILAETDAAPGPGVALGGAAAMGTTPFPPLMPVAPTEDPAEPWYEVGVLAVLPPPPEPVTDGGLALSLTLLARPLVGVVTVVVGAVLMDVTTEFFLVLGALGVGWEPIFLEARVAAPPDAPTGSPRTAIAFLDHVCLEGQRPNDAM
jgi:hypothetical protein